MDTAELTRICQSLPVFPLPRTVLLPGELLPLHVFEPRYRSLVQHCLATDQVMGIATLQPGYEADYHGAPPIHPEIGIGRLVQHQPFPDGRCNIVLSSVGRARLEAEHPGQHAFRELQATLLKDDPRGAEEAMQRLRLLILQLGALSPDGSGEATRLVELDGAELVDTLARKLLRDPDARRAYLAMDRLVDRVGVVERGLGNFVRVGGPAAEA